MGYIELISQFIVIPLPLPLALSLFSSKLQNMNSLAIRVSKLLRSSPISPLVSGEKVSRSWFSTGGPIDEEGLEEDFEETIERPELQPHGVDPRKGWGFRGVHRAIICGKVGQAPLQKILRNGRTVTIFTVGTGGMFDQRLMGATNQPKPAQWHRIAVHNEVLGSYAVQKLAKNSSVYVEGEIETRVYNDSISSEVKSIPEICVRRDGKIRLIKYGESISKISFDELKEGLI
ncbi:single-stranded DNA-binding protein, mitochondrial isoform X2 [Raphanus sativus]|uniref:Single-stranded DNA-binding protein, mitochondrial isoform X2 n=1 Tax=Raphanus sativus TaxID=3726 RepID=A0A6J0LEB0_RAPSA|nr:single-stranded DNA-binding protein, mitochondrial isoform X2 [Raphanus sativus]